MFNDTTSAYPDVDWKKRLVRDSATVFGLGAVGRQVALSLTVLGTSRLHLVDDRLVLIEDLVAGAFPKADAGRMRAEAALGVCFEWEPRSLAGESMTTSHPVRPDGSVFMCDGYLGRLLDSSAIAPDTFCGAAAATERFVQIVTAIGGLPTISIPSAGAAPAYAAGLAAALLIRQYVRYLCGRPLDEATVFDLESGAYRTEPSRD